MKKLFLVLSFLVISYSAFSQTFTFERTDPPMVYYPYLDSAIKIKCKVNNLTGSGFDVLFKVTDVNMPAGWDFAICTWVACYAPGSDTVTEHCTPGEKECFIYFYGNGIPGTGTLTCTVKNTVTNESHSASFGGANSTIGINQISSIVKEFSLEQNYPNPFNPVTNINFGIPKSEFVSLKVYDILGREVRSLVSQNMTPGVYEVNFDASGLSSGMYYYSLRAGDNVSVKKMVLVK
jgi:hypothetical protein